MPKWHSDSPDSTFWLPPSVGSTILPRLALSGDEVSGRFTHFFCCLNNACPERTLANWEVDEELQQEFEEIAENAGCELLEAEFKGGLLRLTIDHPDGVTHELCQTISRQVSAILDVADFGSGRYLLEVSSPGLNRKFYSQRDFERYCGQRVRVTWKNPDMEHKQTVIGMLQTYSKDRNEIELQAVDSHEVHRLSLNDIRIARLEPEL